jgi:copper(I)-binding protein
MEVPGGVMATTAQRPECGSLRCRLVTTDRSARRAGAVRAASAGKGRGVDVNAQPAVTRRLGIGFAVVCATLLSAACSAGQHAQTANEVPAIDGTSGNLGSLSLRAVAIKPPPNGVSYAKGTVAELQLAVINTGTTGDTLTSVSSPATSNIRLFATEADASAAASTPTPTSSPSTSSSATESASGTGSASGSGTATTTGSASSSPSATPSTASTSAASKPPSLAIPAGQVLSLGVTSRDAILDLVVNKVLFPGPSVPITFTFANAGSITLHVPVQLAVHTGDVGISVPPLPSDSAAG